MCQGCVDEGYISQFIFDVIEAFSERFDDDLGVDYGPAHIVIADDNVDDESIDYCLALPSMNEPERGFLRWLKTVPIEERLGRSPEVE